MSARAQGAGDEATGSAAPGDTVVCADGAWTWFNDERALVLPSGAILAGHVRADVAIAVSHHDPATGRNSETVLLGSPPAEPDDHNNPSLTMLGDNTVLAVYSRHGKDRLLRWRKSRHAEPRWAEDWGPEHSTELPAPTTYAHVLADRQGALLAFHRCLNWNPTLSVLFDGGPRCERPRRLIATGGGDVRPYVRLCAGPGGRIDLVYTDHHPRSLATAVYHAFLLDGVLYRTDGSPIGRIADGPADHDGGARGRLVYWPAPNVPTIDEGPGIPVPGARAWVWDVAIGANGRPVCVFSLAVTAAGRRRWMQDRIVYAHAGFDGQRWRWQMIAEAGRPLYGKERHYAGGIALDPGDPSRVVFSSNALDPTDLGACSVRSPTGGCRLYEMRVGGTAPFDATPLTQAGNAIRPKLIRGRGGNPLLFWLDGVYRTYTDYQTRILMREL